MSRSCLESTLSDYVEFSNVETWLPGGNRQRQRRLCRAPNSRRSTHAVRLLTNSASFTMTFHSNDVYDDTGFIANYQFNERRGLSPFFYLYLPLANAVVTRRFVPGVS